jgi:hypothetical protein
MLTGMVIGHLAASKTNQVEQFPLESFPELSIGCKRGASILFARAGRARIAGATRRAPMATVCDALNRSTMANRVCDHFGPPGTRGRPHGRWGALRPCRVAGAFSAIAMLLFLCYGTAAHPPEAEFADWFRSLKEPGTEGMIDSSTSCCSPTRDCQMTDYETDADGRYWIAAADERIQVPFDKILQRTDNPTGRAVACLRYYNGHPVVRCFIRAPEG